MSKLYATLSSEQTTEEALARRGVLEHLWLNRLCFLFPSDIDPIFGYFQMTPSKKNRDREGYEARKISRSLFNWRYDHAFTPKLLSKVTNE